MLFSGPSTHRWKISILWAANLIVMFHILSIIGAIHAHLTLFLRLKHWRRRKALWRQISCFVLSSANLIFRTGFEQIELFINRFGMHVVLAALPYGHTALFFDTLQIWVFVFGLVYRSLSTLICELLVLKPVQTIMVRLVILPFRLVTFWRHYIVVLLVVDHQPQVFDGQILQLVGRAFRWEFSRAKTGRFL